MARFLNLWRRHQIENITPDRFSADDESYMDGDQAAMDALTTLKEFEKLHHLDPNLPLDELIEIDAAINTANPEKGIEIEQILTEDNSPYPEVGWSQKAYLFSSCVLSAAICTAENDASNILSRFERRYGTMMSRYRSTRSAHG
jgi:hypothetical protein